MFLLSQNIKNKYFGNVSKNVFFQVIFWETFFFVDKKMFG
jgi:hypothetical protein